MSIKHTNFAFSSVATAPSPTTSGTSLIVGTGEGARFPTLTGGDTFRVVICPADTKPDVTNAEVVYVTARSTDTFTIVRAQEGSSARDVQVGDDIFLIASSSEIDGLLPKNTAITGATKTKITYDANGLVTVGADATCDDIADGTNTHLVTTAQQTVINNTSGVNTGDQSDATITITDVTTNNASTTKHGWSPKVTAPASGNLSVLGVANGETVRDDKLLLDTTSPSTQAFGDSASAGTAVKAARVDHKHAMPASPTLFDSSPDSDHTVSGLTTTFTANENQAFGDVVYFGSGTTAGKFVLGDADAIASSKIVAMCADASITAGNSGNYLLSGFARDDTWNWTVGGLIYLSVTGTTTNTLTQTAPTGVDDCVIVVGIAVSADIMYFAPGFQSVIERT